MLIGVTVGTCLILWANLVYITFNVLVCRLQKDWEAERFIIYRRWTVESIALGKHTAQSSSRSDINESWQWQWPWEVIHLIHPVFLHRSASLKHPWAELTSATCWSRSLEGGSSLVLLASEDLVILHGLSIPHNHTGLVLFIADWWNTLQSLNFSVFWSVSQS